MKAVRADQASASNVGATSFGYLGETIARCSTGRSLLCCYSVGVYGGSAGISPAISISRPDSSLNSDKTGRLPIGAQI